MATKTLRATSAATRRRSRDGLLRLIGRCLRAWWHRYESRRELEEMDARMLRDIGLTRSAAWEEARKPFWRP
jgi:uncharacterized protein YjiS (DUF1127 family)